MIIDNLQTVSIETPDLRPPKDHLYGRSLYSRFEYSSGSYSALRGEDGKFTVRRLATTELPEVFLGKCTEDKVTPLLNWWVHHDSRLKRIILLELNDWPPEEDLVDLIVEAAHSV